jgi:hypothetical protein
MVRRPDGSDWHGPLPIHEANFAVWATLQVHDGRAHATYRTTGEHSFIGYRSLSLAERTFDQAKDVEVSVPPDDGNLFVANASALLIGPFGERTVVYPVAGRSFDGGRGQLLVAHAGHDGEWRTNVLADDPPLPSGNVAHEHFALARGPGKQAIAIYSKVHEAHRVLYRRILEDGVPMEPARVLARSDVSGAFERIVAMRDGRIATRLLAVVSGTGMAKVGVRAVLAQRNVPTRWQ